MDLIVKLLIGDHIIFVSDTLRFVFIFIKYFFVVASLKRGEKCHVHSYAT